MNVPFKRLKAKIFTTRICLIHFGLFFTGMSQDLEPKEIISRTLQIIFPKIWNPTSHLWHTNHVIRTHARGTYVIQQTTFVLNCCICLCFWSSWEIKFSRFFNPKGLGVGFLANSVSQDSSRSYFYLTSAASYAIAAFLFSQLHICYFEA